MDIYGVFFFFCCICLLSFFFFFQAEDGIRGPVVTGVQTCALPICKNRLHWPVADKTGCIHCHTPHASPVKKLLKAKMADLCSSCHPDAMEQQKRSPTKHPPVKDGMCTTCHAPHASNNVFLFQQASVIELCMSCHDFSKHST